MDRESPGGNRGDEGDTGGPDERIELGDLVAAVCVVLGKLPNEVAELSPAQCELIYETSERARARGKLLDLQIVRAGVHAGFGGDGSQVLFGEVHQLLQRLSAPNDHG